MQYVSYIQPGCSKLVYFAGRTKPVIMYVFKIKDKNAVVDIIVTRALFALATVLALVYRTDLPFSINIIIAVFLFFSAVFTKLIFEKFRYNKMLLVIAAALMLFIATHSLGFSLILILYSLLVHFFYKEPMVEISRQLVVITRTIGQSKYEWQQFSNVIFKDNLLSLDFKNNKLIQLDIEEGWEELNVELFNEFCRECLEDKSKK